MILNVHKINNCIVYKTTLFSKTTVFAILAICVTVFVPFIIGSSGNDFWMRHNTFYEQPTIKFNGKYLFIGNTNNLSHLVMCNNYIYSKHFHGIDECNTVKAFEEDVDFDGKVDIFHFEIDVHLPQDSHLTQFVLLLGIVYKLQSICPLEMQSLILIQQNIMQYNNVLTLMGDLKISQSSPLQCHHKRNQVLYSDLLEDLNVEKMLSLYAIRNMTTELDQIYMNYKKTDEDRFHLNLNVKYLVHEILYKPGFWQIMKWMWIQYVSIYIIFAWIMTKVKNYIFQNNLLLSYKTTTAK